MDSTEIVPYELGHNQSKIDDQTVWLSQDRMVDLFNNTKQNIRFFLNVN
ncbi:hypothetical protein [Portibacter lacus]|nr:hypothetical protein [Portibacter lacus]